MKAPSITWLLLALLCSIHSWGWSQYQLVLEKPGAFKRERIYAGDEISIRVKGMDQMYAGELQGVKANQIYIFGDSISPDSLDRIFIARPRHLLNMLRGTLIMSAILYPVMMVINLTRDQWTWKKAAEVGAVSVSALVVQRGIKIFYWKRIHLDKDKWRLRIMPTVESLH